MKIVRVEASGDVLSDANHALWKSAPLNAVPLVPTPLKGNPAILRISPFLEKSTDHGTATEVKVAAVHNGTSLAVRLDWASGKHNEIRDLDEFVDGAAVMFPLTPKASAFTMGSDQDPVNAWYWKANRERRAFDVVARGYGTSARSSSDKFPILSTAVHANGRWTLIMVRELRSMEGRAQFEPGAETRMAFAIWDGGNRERAGRKSFSGDFVPVPIE